MITYNIDLKFILIIAIIVFLIVRNFKMIVGLMKAVLVVSLFFYVIFNYKDIFKVGKENYQYVDKKVEELDLKCQIDTTTKEVKITK
jgi:hypothetical protein